MQATGAVVRNLTSVLTRIEQARQRCTPDMLQACVRLVAVSKTKPVEDIVAAYQAGQRHFGENYSQELVEKATDKRLLTECTDIQWHFIGHLQRNKVKKLLKLDRLYCIESVDSRSIAEELQKEATKLNRQLNIFIQVNTSDEDQKSGCEANELVDLCRFVICQCDRLALRGLMTIGSLVESANAGQGGVNRDFITLRQYRAMLFKEVEDLRQRSELPSAYAQITEPGHLELSMGMSGDFEAAVAAGSTNVRVGSLIFGARDAPTISNPTSS